MINYLFNPFTGNFDAVNDAVGPSPTPTTFALANNQVAPANVTGFLVDPLVNTAFSAEISIRREATNAVPGGNDGTPNATFQTNAGTGFVGTVWGSAVQSDGSIIVTGDMTSYNGTTINRVCRISQYGVLDTAFSTNLGTGPDATVNCALVQSDGKIVIGGSFTSVDGQAFSKLARLNTDGSVDSGFMNTVGGFDSDVYSVKELSAGNNSNLIVGGSFTSFTAEDLSVNAAPSILGLSNNGKLIVPGIVFAPVGTGFNASVYGVAVDGSDNVFATGQFTQYDGVTAYKSIKLNSAGVKQTGFDDLGADINTFRGWQIAVQPDGAVIVAGQICRASAVDRVDLWRYDNTGADDTAFNNNLSVVGGAGSARCLGLQSDGKILLGGQGTYNSNNKFCRINSDGTDDTTFNTATSPGFDAFSDIYTILVTTDDVAYVGGDNAQTFAGNNVADNLIMLGEFASSVTVEIYQQAVMRGVFKSVAGAWEINLGTAVGNSTGVDFTMTNAGQLQYTSSNLAGVVALNEMRFLVTAL